jgi:hypothetical protein
MKYYIMYDGRAESGDTDEASVLEALGNKFTKSNFSLWKNHDAVLVEYDVYNENELVNERVIGHLREGYKTLRARL